MANKVANTVANETMKMMDVVIRCCALTDAAAIQKLNREQMGYEYSLDNTRAKLEKLLSSEADRLFVAVINDAVVGYVHANDYDVIYAPSMKNIMGLQWLKNGRVTG